MQSADKACEYVIDARDPETWGGKQGEECLINDDILDEDNTWTCPHECKDGEDLCIFHKPPSVKSSEEVIRAFIKKITASEADNTDGSIKHFIGAKFNTSISSEKHKIPEQIEHDLVMDYAEIGGPVRIKDTVLKESASFSGCKFRGKVDFRGTKFEGKVIFEEAKFEKKSDFQFAVFNSDSVFESASFDGLAAFARSTFKQRLEFKNAEVDGQANFNHLDSVGPQVDFSSADLGSIYIQGVDFKLGTFNNMKVRNEAMFSGSSFNRYALFPKCTFGGDAEFDDVEFSDGARFSRSEFLGDASFRQSIFGDKTSFRDSEFEQKADFGRSVFNEEGNFAGVAFQGHADYSEVVFNQGAEFRESEFQDVAAIESQHNPLFTHAELQNAIFTGVNLSHSNFAGADLSKADLSQAYLADSDLESAILSRATLFGTDLKNSKIFGAVFANVRIDEGTEFLGRTATHNRSPHTLAAIRSQPTCVYDPLHSSKEEHTDTDKAKSVYQSLEELGKRHARPRLQARAFVRRQDLQKTSYWRVATAPVASNEERFIAGARWGRAKVARATFLYGESPWRVIGWSLGIIFAFALLYPVGGWMKPTDGSPITYTSSPVELLNSVYYSTLTYTALGFGDFQPVGFGRLLTTIETGLGAVMLALLVFILGRRAAR